MNELEIVGNRHKQTQVIVKRLALHELVQFGRIRKSSKTFSFMDNNVKQRKNKILVQNSSNLQENRGNFFREIAHQFWKDNSLKMKYCTSNKMIAAPPSFHESNKKMKIYNNNYKAFPRRSLIHRQLSKNQSIINRPKVDISKQQRCFQAENEVSHASYLHFDQNKPSKVKLHSRTATFYHRNARSSQKSEQIQSEREEVGPWQHFDFGQGIII